MRKLILALRCVLLRLLAGRSSVVLNVVHGGSIRASGPAPVICNARYEPLKALIV